MLDVAVFLCMLQIVLKIKAGLKSPAQLCHLHPETTPEGDAPSMGGSWAGGGVLETVQLPK